MTQPMSPQGPPSVAGGESDPATESGSKPGNRQPRDRSGARLAAGAVLVLLALVLFAGSRVVAAGQHHAYDPAANPPSAYHVTAGKTYQLSSARSVAELKKAGLLGGDLACFATSSTGEQTPVTVASTSDDDRNLHLFATMVAPRTGEVRLSCTGIPEVFLDDADNAAPDRSAVLVLLSIVAGLVGVIAACSGGYARGLGRQPAGHLSARG